MMTLQIKTESEEIQTLNLDDKFLEFYKKETGHKHALKKQVAKFIETIATHFNQSITFIV